LTVTHTLLVSLWVCLLFPGGSCPRGGDLGLVTHIFLIRISAALFAFIFSHKAFHEEYQVLL
jgi:hypothetical protein